MRESAWVWITGGIAAATTITSTILNAFFSFHLPNDSVHTSLRALLLLSFALQIISTIALSYFSTIYTRSLHNQELKSKRVTWSQLGAGMAVVIVSIAVTCAALVCTLKNQKALPTKIVHQPATALLAAWFAVWGLSLLLDVLVFVILGFWTKNVLRAQAVRCMNVDFGIRLPPMEDIAPGSRPSFCTRDSTLASRPTSRAPSSFRTSASTRIGTAYSSRTKLVRNSSRSSLDAYPFPAGEATSIETAFDNWDTSTLHNEMRCTVLGSSPPATRNGLEPIPGSRPESPEEPALPSSPIVVSSEALVPSDNDSSPQPELGSSPPSSPPNFSRPTSKSQNKPFGAGLDTTYSMQEIIHPLFRQGSPDPPPNAIGGTMVTASPYANRPITPKTLSQLRGKTDFRKSHQGGGGGGSAAINTTTGQWRTMPSVDATARPRSKSHSSAIAVLVHEKRPSTAGSVDSVHTAVTTAAKSDFGSPGPSIYEEDELPPILPGFVLGAGQRSSMIGYGKRKSVKKSPSNRASLESWRNSRGSFIGSERAFRSTNGNSRPSSFVGVKPC